MLSDQELLELIAGGESVRVEFKARLDKSVSDKLRKTICAFANDLSNHGQASVIVIGLNDKGECSGEAITDEMQRTLAQMRQEVTPFPSIDVNKRIIKDCEVLVMEVHPSSDTPLHYGGRVWVWRGTETGVASPADEQRLIEKRRWRSLPFELQPAAFATLNDLDLDFFTSQYLPQAVAREVLQDNHRPFEQQLAALRMIGNDGIPTVIGILICGKDPQQYLPGAYVQFLRLDGLAVDDPIIDRKEITGTILTIATRLDDILRANIRVETDFQSGFIERTIPDYPIVALRQISLNALLHRSYQGTNAPVRVYWYRDRIEIQSPGGPFGIVTARNFGQGVSDYRNKNLAEAMKHLGLVQQFGVGIPTAKRAMEQNGNPPIEFQVTEYYVTVTLRSRIT
ncbi:MAG: hypothetical protein OHK0023_22870 [Anaerolineae bacterium]